MTMTTNWHPADLCCPRCGSDEICPLNDLGEAWICKRCITTWVWVEAQEEDL